MEDMGTSAPVGLCSCSHSFRVLFLLAVCMRPPDAEARTGTEPSCPVSSGPELDGGVRSPGAALAAGPSGPLGDT